MTPNAQGIIVVSCHHCNQQEQILSNLSGDPSFRVCKRCNIGYYYLNSRPAVNQPQQAAPAAKSDSIELKIALTFLDIAKQ